MRMMMHYDVEYDVGMMTKHSRQALDNWFLRMMMHYDVEEDGGMMTKHSRQALECLEVPSIENGTAGQFQVAMIVMIRSS